MKKKTNSKKFIYKIEINIFNILIDKIVLFHGDSKI